ncbi:PEGA domain-containing protein [Desulfobacterales bacterium HSG16]|nr:PEGA domain-containing protein [Desulfobacterales bacterium HSG16]
MKKKIIVFICMCLSAVISSAGFCNAGNDRGIIRVKAGAVQGGVAIDLYKGSHALLIGVSDYTAGWPDLESIPGELSKVELLLKARGFKVEKTLDPDSLQLKKTFEDFIKKYGYQRENRLLFFYSGHGHTRLNNSKGYLVPTDAPNPRNDVIGFQQKALGMTQILAWARDIEAKHALFLFDSCFSGTIFKQKDLPDKPPHITRMTAKPVRQFITAGNAGESVPANSTFTPAFVDAIEYGIGDLNDDGYVSGTELGLYLQGKVPQHTSQTPQFGKIRDYELSRGDFIFLASGEATVIRPSKKCTLELTANVSGAKVYLNDRYTGTTPLEGIEVSPGKYRIRLEKKGYVTEHRKKTFKKGRTMSIEVYMDEESHVSRLYVDTDPENADVRILNISPKYYDGMELDPGKYHVEVSADGYETRRKWISLAVGQDKNISIRLTEKYVPTGPKETSRDGSFIAYDDGTVVDTKTGLMWAAKDNGKNINWNDAKRYCESYSGGGYSDWRLPAIDELKGLYDKGKKGYKFECCPGCDNARLTHLIRVTCWIWASETSGSSAALFFFSYGSEYQRAQSLSYDRRVLPVRAGN